MAIQKCSALVPARHFGADGIEIWLRRWALRRLHGPREWTGHAILRGSHARYGRKGSHDGRRLEKNGLHPVQKAWMQINVPQCGYCQVGQIMQAAALLNSKKKPTDHEIDEAMSGTSAVAERISGFAAIKAAAGKWHERD